MVLTWFVYFMDFQILSSYVIAPKRLSFEKIPKSNKHVFNCPKPLIKNTHLEIPLNNLS